MSNTSRNDRGRIHSFAFGPANYGLLAAGAVAVVLGYVMLDGGSVTAAPLLLILGYVILLPAGILFGWSRIRGERED